MQKCNDCKTQQKKKKYITLPSLFFSLRVLLETPDPLVLLVPRALASICLPSLVWVRLRKAPILSGTWEPTRLLEISDSMMLRSTPLSNLSTTRLRTSAALRDPRKTLLAPAETWNCATLTGRVVSDTEGNWLNLGWDEKTDRNFLPSQFSKVKVCISQGSAVGECLDWADLVCFFNIRKTKHYTINFQVLSDF